MVQRAAGDGDEERKSCFLFPINRRCSALKSRYWDLARQGWYKGHTLAGSSPSLQHWPVTDNLLIVLQAGPLWLSALIKHTPICCFLLNMAPGPQLIQCAVSFTSRGFALFALFPSATGGVSHWCACAEKPLYPAGGNSGLSGSSTSCLSPNSHLLTLLLQGSQLTQRPRSRAPSPPPGRGKPCKQLPPAWSPFT